MTKVEEIRSRVLCGRSEGSWYGAAFARGHVSESDQKLPVCPHSELLIECASVLGITPEQIIGNHFHCGSYHYTVHTGRDPFFGHPGHDIDVSPRHNFCMDLYRVLSDIARYLEKHPSSDLVVRREDELVVNTAKLTANNPAKMREEIDQAELFIAMSSFSLEEVKAALAKLVAVFGWEEKDFSIEGIGSNQRTRKLRKACDLEPA